jgi:5-carboxymethyl-2-hydroxymuconate isomerase
MPHVTLEYTNNIDSFDKHEILRGLNRVLAATGHFDEIDIKSRAVLCDHFVIGTSADPRAFIHVTLSILSGRSPEVKRSLTKALVEELHSAFSNQSRQHLQITAEVLDIERESYAKTVIGS